MNARAWLFTLSVLLTTGSAAAQKRMTVGFDTDCAGQPTPGNFALGFKQVSGSLYAGCGVASVTSGSGSGTQQLAQASPSAPIAGITGSVALAGAVQIGLSWTFNPIVIVFSPAVNEVSFDALGLNNANGLSVTLAGAANVALPPLDMPPAQGGIVHYARISATPIERITIAYQETGLIDGWFLDQLSFNTWSCGDGELESNPLNTALEACDDGNSVQCDGCNNSCQVSTVGCFDGSACVAPGTPGGCTFCDVSKAPDASGNVATTPRPATTPCDDSLFCTTGDACDGAGKCASAPNACSDGIVCTVDSCEETNDTCLHPVEDKWCLIGGMCFANGTGNPTNKCELCASTKTAIAWDKQPSGLQCGDPSCAHGVESAAATCDANGVCQPGATTSCQFAACQNAVSCDATCSGDQNCPEQAHCMANTKQCVADMPKATACTRNAECASGFCIDGVCCDKACNGACEACNLAPVVGTCTQLAERSIDPEDRCASGQFCSAGKCMSDPPPPPAPTPPPPAPADVRPMGTGCDTGAVCGSGVCKDGVCCDRACDGVCESCNVLGQLPGQCTPYALGDDPDQECAGAGGVCSGEGTCTEYETRGNGLCATSPRPLARASGLGFGALLALVLALAVRRRSAESRQKKSA